MARLLLIETKEISSPAKLPRIFAQKFGKESLPYFEARVLLAGPCHPDYWQVWDWALSNAQVKLAKTNLSLTIINGELWGVSE